MINKMMPFLARRKYIVLLVLKILESLKADLANSDHGQYFHVNNLIHKKQVDSVIWHMLTKCIIVVVL